MPVSGGMVGGISCIVPSSSAAAGGAPAACSVLAGAYTAPMALVTYSNEPHGFGFVYDAARFACVDDPGDPRHAAARSSQIDGEIAASVLFTLAGCTADEVGAGAVYSMLVTTDSVAPGTRLLGGWDWDDVMLDAAESFLEKTSAAYLDAYQIYWRGFPIVQLTARPGPEIPSPHPLEEIGMLYTPRQTFTSLVVWPTDDREALGPVARELWDGFFLVPLEREGKVRTGHQLVKHLEISLTEKGYLAVLG
jgi:hypothetical protein